MRSKKGMATEMGFIITTSLVLISFFLIIGLFARFSSRTNDLEAELLCQTSIAQRVRTAVNIDWDDAGGLSLFTSQVKTIPPLCRTIDKKVSGSREQVLRQVADNMARCWWMFGEGRYQNLLDDVQADVLPDILGFEDLAPYTGPDDANQCFNCYTILVDQDEIPGGPITGTEMMEFLRTKKYAKVDKIYLDYIQGFGGPGRIVLTIPEILPREAYAISMMPKNQGDSTFWKGQIQSAAGTLTGNIFLLYVGQQNILADAFKERDVSSIYFSSLEEGQNRCGEGDIAGQ